MTFPITKTAEHTVAVGDLVSATVGGAYVFPTYLVTSDGTAIAAANPLAVTPGTGASWAVTAASLPLPSGAATSAKQDTEITHLATLAGAVSGTEVQVDVLTLPTVTVQDGGGSITVDGTVAVSGSVAVTNAGTFAVQAAQSGTWNITNISGTVSLPTGAATAAKQPALGTAGTASSDVLTVQGISGMTALKVDGSAVTQPVSGTFWQATQPVSIASPVAVTDNGGSLTVDAPVGTPVFVRLSDGASAIDTLPVSLASVPSHAVTNAGTFAVQVDGTALTRLTDIETNTDSGAVVGNGAAATAQRVTLANDSTGIVSLTTSTASIGKLASNSGVTIGAVELAAAQTLATVTTVSTVTTLTGGGVAHDGADSGNPVKVGGKAVTTQSGQTAVASGDRSDLIMDLDGTLIARNVPHGDILTGTASTTGTSDTSVIAAQGVGVFTYVDCITVVNTGSTTALITLKDGSGGSALWYAIAPAGGGAVISKGGKPIFKTSANTALYFAAGSASTTIYISVSGYKSKV